MENNQTIQVQKDDSPFITASQLITYWQGHRGLTRRVIEAFPEKELFEYSIGGMRPFSVIVAELLAIAVPGVKGLATKEWKELDEDIDFGGKKEKLLELWDQATEELDKWWAKLDKSGFQEKVQAFGQYEGTVFSSVLYFIDNEIHHRGQAYVYLRSLGITPPYFWEH